MNKKRILTQEKQIEQWNIKILETDTFIYHNNG